MNPLKSNLVCAAGLVAALPLLGVSAAIQINGSCYGPGSCLNPANPTDSVSYNQTVSGSTTNNIAVSAEPFNVSTSYSTSYTGASESITFLPTITYTGTVPLATAATVTVDLLQDIYDPTPGPFSAGSQTEDVTLTIPADATGSGQLFFNGAGLPLVGPYGPGNYQVINTQPFGPVNSQYLAYDYQFIFKFSPGLPPGSSGGSPLPPSSVPEPAQAVPIALSMIALGVVFRRRRRKDLVCL